MREHRVTRRAPTVMLAEERERLHPLPAVPHTVCFGQTRKVGWQATISVGGALYSVPSSLVDERVWARVEGCELVVVHADSPEGPRVVARHRLTTPGRPSIKDEHYPPRPAGALERRPQGALVRGGGVPAARARRRVLGWSRRPPRAPRGCGARWPKRSTSPNSAGRRRSSAPSRICAEAGRFADGDLAAILAHQASAEVIEFPARASERSEAASMQRSTAAWEGFGR